MSPSLTIAIDPGASGGIAWHQAGADPSIAIRPLPETRGDGILLVREIIGLTPESNIVAYHEENPDYIPSAGQGTMVAYGRGQERYACILETLGIRLIMVRPKTWQKELGLGSSDRMPVPQFAAFRPPKLATPADKKALRTAHLAQKREFETFHATAIKSAQEHNDRAKRDWKHKLKAMAQRLYPFLRVTEKTQDAILMLEYALRQQGGGQVIVPGVKPGNITAEPMESGLFPT